MQFNFSKYLFLTGFFLIVLLSIQTCSRPLLSNRQLYVSDVVVVHSDRSRDTIRKVVFFDYLLIDQMDNLVKKDGFVVSQKLKKFKCHNVKDNKKDCKFKCICSQTNCSELYLLKSKDKNIYFALGIDCVKKIHEKLYDKLNMR
jgi:hypothetical protein